MPSQKNIVVIFNDDHGQWALPAYGNSELRTPTLDHLAQTGVVMENAFTPTPVCSPARACFQTGRLASQHGLHDYIASGEGFEKRRWLDAETTLPELLHGAGYQVGMSGKWHLGNDLEPHPGFDRWFALSGDYPIEARGAYRYSRDGEIVEIDGYKSQVITDAAIDFLRGRDCQRPFFLFVGHTATHSPWADHPQRLVDQYRDCRFGDIPPDTAYPFGHQNLESRDLVSRTGAREALMQYYAAVSSLDEAVGRLIDELEALALRDDTLIVYTSDHGLCCGHHGIWGKGNGTMPLNMVEESIRIPMIFNHPTMLFSGQRRIEFVDHLDLFQTLAAFAGVGADREPPKGYAGRSFLPMLTNEPLEGSWRTTQICEYGSARMIRTTRYKLLHHHPSGPTLLFDLKEDPRETLDLSQETEFADLVERLSEQLDAHFRRYELPANSGIRDGGPEPTNRTAPWVV